MVNIPFDTSPRPGWSVQDAYNALLRIINTIPSFDPANVNITGGTITGVTGNFTSLQLNGVGVVTLTGTQTLTNKTLTAPAINGGTITGSTINSSTIGLTTPAAARFTTVKLDTSLTFPDNTVQITAATGNGTTDVLLRGVRVACAGTSIYGDNNTQYEYFVTKYGNYVQRVLNGGNSGQQAQNIADHFHTNVVNQNPGIVLLAIASNDFLGGLPTDPPAPGAGSIANAKFYLTRVVEQARAAGIRVCITTEPYRNPPQTGANSNPIYWNSTYLPAFVAALADPNVILSDTASVIADPSTGNLLIPLISTNGTGVNGASVFTVASATGITRGMYCNTASGALTPDALTKRVTGISGTTITFSGTISGTLNETVYFYVDVFDNVHPSPVGANKQADKLYTDMNAAGWLPTYHSLKPLTSNGPSASIDNLISNGTLEAGSTGGVGTGFSTNFSGTKSVGANANFIGNVQLVTLVPGEAAGRFLSLPSADVTGLRGRWIRVSIKAQFTGFQPNGGLIDLRGQFNVNPPALPPQITNDSAQPIYFSNVSICDGVYLFNARVQVPQSASSFGWLFTNNVAFPAGASTNATIQVGEIVVNDDTNPLADCTTRIPAFSVPSFSASGLVISQYDGYIGIDASSGSISKALPAAGGWRGRPITIKKTDASANTITLTGAADGSIVLSLQNQSATFMSDETTINLIASTGLSSGGTPGGSTTQMQYNNAGAFGGATWAYTSGTGALTGTTAAAAGFAVGPNGNTNPVLRLVCNTASQADGISITGLAAGSGVTLQGLTSGTNAPMTIAAAGNGTITLGNGNGGVVSFGGFTVVNGGTVGSVNAFQTQFQNNQRGSALAGFEYNSAPGTFNASTNVPVVRFQGFSGSATVNTYNTGAKTLQTDFWVGSWTNAAGAASTITDAVTHYVQGAPIAGTNITQTNAHGSYVDANNVTSSTTNSYGQTVNAQTGATNNYIQSLRGSAGEVLRIRSDGQIFALTTITAAGTTGAQTINKPSGTVNFAAAATSVVVTNSLCTVNSIVFAVIRKADATFTQIKSVVPAAGSFTITANNAATAETSVGFLIIN